MASDCLFCKFVSKEIRPNLAYEDDQVMVFHDIHPQAPVHALVIPKKHIDSVSAIPSGDPIVSILTERAVKVAAQLGIAQEGFRLVFNNGHNGGQTISHLHLHLLGGRPMAWPPG
ncbi:MAG TPA: histidine triad nucleotide-binding protein [bacterium]|nr:histidine triad nucleotide-binding protein [bacterium]